jgi:CheY-like chemotaxis protein
MGDKVLVVEDEPTLLETLEYNLARQGYEVYTASTGHVHPLIIHRRGLSGGLASPANVQSRRTNSATLNLTWLSPCAIMRLETAPSGWGRGRCST